MVAEDEIDAKWIHRVKVMAGKVKDLDQFSVPEHAALKRYEDEIHLHHLEASWPARELVRVPVMEAAGAYLLVVAWWIGDGKVSAAMVEAGAVLALAFGKDPSYAFIRSIPAGAEEFVEVKGICLVQANWVPDGFIAVTSGGMTRGLKGWERSAECEESQREAESV
jgi:hypothetical protein